MPLSVSVVEGAPPSLARPGAAVGLPVLAPEPAVDGQSDAGPQPPGHVPPTAWTPPDDLAAAIAAFLRDVEHRGGPGSVQVLPLPTRHPAQVLLFGVGDRQARAWRDAGAALYRAAADRVSSLTVALPAGAAAATDGGPLTADQAAAELALGALLAAYRFAPPVPSRRPRRSTASPTGKETKLREIILVMTGTVERTREAVARSAVLAGAIAFARDLTNTPSVTKSPDWFAGRVAQAAAHRPGVSLTVLDEVALADAGFGGLLAVGGGSRRPPRLVELSWRPRGARAHVVLAGKGICFDTGGISIKPLEGMKLMRKDMGAAAAVCATVLAAADLRLPIRVTALAPLAENMISGASMRPGDVIRQYGGTTVEILDTDAEGRLVLGDAIAYAARRLKPDWLIDLATLTGASHVALGKQIAALFSPNPELLDALRGAGDEAGEPVWPMPLTDDYVGLLRSEVADLANIGRPAQAGAITAALFLRELAGDRRDQWAHIDMSAPAWSDRDAGPLVRGATGWGVRLLVSFLTSL